MDVHVSEVLFLVLSVGLAALVTTLVVFSRRKNKKNI